MSKVVFHERLTEVGKAEVKYHDKTSEVLKVYHQAEHQLLVLHPQETLKSAFSNQLVDQLFSMLKSEGAKFERIVLIDSLYKTHYSTTDTGYLEQLGDSYPLKFYKTSWAKNDAVLTNFTSKLQPAGVLNLIGGFPAAVMIYAELNGIPAAKFVSIVDSHYVTSETLQAFAPLVHEVLGVEAANLNEVHRMPGFKEALKEAN